MNLEKALRSRGAVIGAVYLLIGYLVTFVVGPGYTASPLLVVFAPLYVSGFAIMLVFAVPAMLLGISGIMDNVVVMTAALLSNLLVWALIGHHMEQLITTKDRRGVLWPIAASTAVIMAVIPFINNCRTERWAPYPLLLVALIWAGYAWAKSRNLKRSMTSAAISLAVVFLVFQVFWNPFNECGWGSSTTVTGFAKIKPVLSSININSDGMFTGIFTNGAGGQIDIRAADLWLTDVLNGTNCTDVKIDSNGKAADKLFPGENFRLSAKCSPDARGNVYVLRVALPYVLSRGGLVSDQTEEGTIRGAYE